MSNPVSQQPQDPTEFARLRTLIVEIYPELSRQQKEISEFALANPEIIAVETAAQLAKRLNIQPSGLVRWAQALGFPGLKDLKRQFSSHLIFKVADARDREAAAESSATGPDALLDSLLAESAEDIRHIRQHFDRTRFAEAADRLISAREIYVTAQHLAFPLATLFAWTLLRFGRQCNILDNTGGFALRQSELAGPEDTTLAISFQPYQPSVVQAAKAHVDRGGVVVSVTDSPLSPLARYSTILLETPNRQPTVAHSVAAATCIVQALALTVCQASRPSHSNERET